MLGMKNGGYVCVCVDGEKGKGARKAAGLTDGCNRMGVGLKGRGFMNVLAGGQCGIAIF